MWGNFEMKRASFHSQPCYALYHYSSSISASITVAAAVKVPALLQACVVDLGFQLF